MTKFWLIWHKNGGLPVVFKGKGSKYCTQFRSKICTASSVSSIYSCLKGPLDNNKLMRWALESCLLAVCLQAGKFVMLTVIMLWQYYRILCIVNFFRICFVTMKLWNIRKLRESNISCFLPWNSCRDHKRIGHCLSLRMKKKTLVGYGLHWFIWR